MAKPLIDYDTLTPSLKRLLPRVDAAVDLVFDYAVATAETAMRTNAPWHDRTGNARAGLGAIHNADPMRSHTLTLFHSVSYGIWLELRWSGRYAIIGPTLFDLSETMSKQIAQAIDRAMKLKDV